MKCFFWWLAFAVVTYAILKLQFVYAAKWMEWLLNDINHSPLVALIAGVYLLVWIIICNEYMGRKKNNQNGH